MSKDKLDRKDLPDSPFKSVEKRKRVISKAKKPYCIAIALKNHHCNMNGFLYDFKEGEEVKIQEKWHYDRLSHPYNIYVKKKG